MNNYSEKADAFKGQLRINDMRNAAAEICAFFIGKRIIMCDHGKAYACLGSHMQLIKQDRLISLIYCLINAAQSAEIPSRAVDEAAKRLLRHPSLQVDMEAERAKTTQLINCRNGFYDISSEKYYENRGEMVFDYVLDFRYDPDVDIRKASVFLGFVESSLGQRFLKLLLQIIGYCLSSLTNGRKAFLLLGRGSTGKSTFLEFLEQVIGEVYCSHVPFHRMGDIHARAEYIGKRINISRENSDVAMRDEDAFKNLVSCEMTTGRRLYENAVDFVPRAKFIFASNIDLHFAHPDDAVYERLLVMQFDKTIPKEKRDPMLLSKLMEKRDIILSAAVKTLPELIRSGYDFCEPEESKAIIVRYRAALHTADSFLEEYCEINAEATVSSVALFQSYNEWCLRNGLEADGQKTFYARVRAYDSNIKDGKVFHNGNRVNGFRGLGFKQSADNAEKQ